MFLVFKLNKTLLEALEMSISEQQFKIKMIF